MVLALIFKPLETPQHVAGPLAEHWVDCERKLPIMSRKLARKMRLNSTMCSYKIWPRMPLILNRKLNMLAYWGYITWLFKICRLSITKLTCNAGWLGKQYPLQPSFGMRGVCGRPPVADDWGEEGRRNSSFEGERGSAATIGPGKWIQ